MNTIYLIRHGKTLANEHHLYCGQTDISLSDTGRKELAAQNYRINHAVFISSGMKRTDETLQILFPGVPFQQDPCLREVNFGDFEMKSYDQLKDLPSYQNWITGDNEKNIPPHGESGEQMTQRVLAAFQRYADSTQDYVLVTHGGVISAIMASYFPNEQKNRYQWQPKPGHGYLLIDGVYQAI